MTDVFLQIGVTLFGVKADLDVRVAGGPLSISLAPQQPIPLIEIWNSISDELNKLVGVELPNISSGPWAKIFQVDQATTVLPSFWLTPTGGKLAVYLQLELSKPIGIGGTTSIGGLTITLEPDIQIWSLYIGYTQGQGVDLRAKISIPTQTGQKALPEAAGDGEKFEIVSYPFPVPAQNSVGVFQLKYLGLGQRVGPNVVVNSNDPLAAIFQQLETDLVGDDPATILTRLATNFYKPDRNWFIAADLAFRGWQLRVLFNDPVMYGLELSAPMQPLTPFSGLLFEILYQKLSPNLGVYYGALTLPYFLRRIVINGVILILPGFSIWVYTNGDFRVNIGWPLGNSSIGIQVGPLNGIAGFYFAKLRSADNPGAQSGPQYDLILQFGIGLSVFVRQGFSASIFSATISVTVTATLQGLLAWRTGGITSGPPDHYWFAGTAGVAVLLQGTVDFSILKASVTVSLTANASVAFETGYMTVIAVSASVRVEVSVKVVFFTIHLSFHTSVSAQFTIGSGPPASANGPLAPGLSAFAPSPLLVAMHEDARALARRTIEKLPAQPLAATGAARAALNVTAASPETLYLYFVLQPTAVYADAGSSIALIASLFIDSPDPAASSPAPQTDFEKLLIAIVMWLLNNYSTPGRPWSERFQQVADALGSGSQPPVGFGGWQGFATAFKKFLQSSITFNICDVDSDQPPPLHTAAILPIFEDLDLTYTGADGHEHTIEFVSYNLTPLNYPEAVNKYFEELNWGGSAPPSMARASQASGSPSMGPSMASYLFYDYFLMQSRNAIKSLLDAARRYEKEKEDAYLRAVESAHAAPSLDHWGFVELVVDYCASISVDGELDYLLNNFDYLGAAGLGSRYLLHGLQLPDPSQTPDRPTQENMAAVPTDGLYVLTGQQFEVEAGITTGAATLTLNPNSGAPPDWIVFESGSPGSATCKITLPDAVPAKPSPEWQGVSGSPQGGGDGVIQLSELPPITPHPLYFALKNQVAWDAPDGPRTILPLPQPLMALSQVPDGIQLQISTEPPPDTFGPPAGSSPDVILEALPGLLVRLSISQVQADSGANVGPGGSPPVGSPPGGRAIQFLPFVYQISGTDEATRDLIYQALQQDLSDASILLLYTPSGGGNVQSEQLSPSVLVAKTNLSTLNQIARTGNMFAALLADLGPEYVNFAPIGDAKGFLRMIWEVSVVNAPGFFLFYLTSDGQDLPADLFSDAGASGGQSAEFDILIQFAEKPGRDVAVKPWGNCVWFEGAAPTGSLFAGVFDSHGSPVPQYGPTYPAGNIGFEIDWAPLIESPEPEVPVESLYQMIQYSITPSALYDGSIWSLPVGPTRNGPQGSPPAGSLGSGIWQYQQTVPVYRFVNLPSPPYRNRYCAIGNPVDLGLRLIDVYGDALPDVHRASFTPLYQDPLISIGQWPGVFVDYYLEPYSNAEAALVITINFDPDSIVPPGGFSPPASPPDTFNAAQQWVSVLDRYGLIFDQLEDPNVQVSVMASLTGGAIGDSGAIRTQLQQFVMQVIEGIVVSSPPDASPSYSARPVAGTIVLPVPFSAIIALDVDILPVTVNVSFERDEQLVYPPAIKETPTALRVSYIIPANLNLLSPDSPASSPAVSSGITAFARWFELAFQGFDGGSGLLKLAQRSGVHTGQGASEVTSLWGVRWSRSAGISIEFDESLVYFALQPLNTKLMNDTVDGETFTNVDIGAWAREFLSAVDSFLLPRNAVAVALLDDRNATDYYDTLMRHKESLAQCIPQGLAAVLAPQVGEGDLTAARERLEQALLTALSSAFTVSTIAQIAATVKVAGRTEDKASPNLYPPSLFGNVGPPPTGSPAGGGSPNAASQYTISSGELNIASGRQWMTTLISVAQPKEQAELEMPLAYEVSYLQHDFEPGQEFLGYVPSSWLKFALPGAPPLNMPITDEAHIPIPLALYPQAPVLIGQSAAPAAIGSPSVSSPNDIETEIGQALEWVYQAQFGHDWAKQDQLYFTVTYNLPAKSRSASLLAARDPLDLLFDALARFRKVYAAISPQFGAIAQEAYPIDGASGASPAVAADLVEQFTVQVGLVAEAWAELYGALPIAAESSKGGLIIVDDYMIYLDSVQDGVVHLLARTQSGNNPKYWPIVTTKDGSSWQPDRDQAQPPDSRSGWWKLSHAFSPAADFAQLTFDWGPLDVIDRQTAKLSAYIVRNANLLIDVGIPTNEAFIYRTATVEFPSPVIPLIQRGALQPVQPEATLVKTLESILRPIVGLGRNLNPLMRFKASYSYQLVPSPVGEGLRASSAILLANDVSLGELGSPVPEIAAEIASELAAWYDMTQPSTSQAILSIALTLFGTISGQQLPLVQIQEIPIMVSDVGNEWWASTQ